MLGISKAGVKQQHIAMTVIGVIVSRAQIVHGEVQVTGIGALEDIGHQVVQRLLIVQQSADIEHGPDDRIVTKQPVADLLMLMAGERQRQRGKQRGRQVDGGASVLAGDGAP